MIDMNDMNEPPEFDTPEEDMEAQRQERLIEEQEAARNDMLWNHFAGHFGRDGRLVIPIRYRQPEE